MCDATVTYMFVLMLIFVFALLLLDPTEYCPCIDAMEGSPYNDVTCNMCTYKMLPT